MNTENKDNCPSCNVPWVEHLGVQGLCKELQKAKAQIKWHSGCENKCGEELDALQADNQRLRSALEAAADFVVHPHPNYSLYHIGIVRAEIDAALSPSAPAEQEVSQGEWREFVPSPENPVRKGDAIRSAGNDYWTWVSGCIGDTGPIGNIHYRRFHPATNQEDGQ